VAPKATDLLIDARSRDHYAWLDTKVPSNPQLLVSCPASRHGLRPLHWSRRRGPARLPRHRLMYQNDVVARAGMPRAPALQLLRERGVWTSRRRRPQLSPWRMSARNSIDIGLTKLLLYLDSAYPDRGGRGS